MQFESRHVFLVLGDDRDTMVVSQFLKACPQVRGDDEVIAFEDFEGLFVDLAIDCQNR